MCLRNESEFGVHEEWYYRKRWWEARSGAAERRSDFHFGLLAARFDDGKPLNLYEADA